MFLYMMSITTTHPHVSYKVATLNQITFHDNRSLRAMLEDRTMKYFLHYNRFHFPEEINCIVLSSNMAYAAGVYCTKLWTLDFLAFFYNISKIFPVENRWDNWFQYFQLMFLPPVCIQGQLYLFCNLNSQIIITKHITTMFTYAYMLVIFIMRMRI